MDVTSKLTLLSVCSQFLISSNIKMRLINLAFICAILCIEFSEILAKRTFSFASIGFDD